jgi:hypothetical protein
MAHGPTTMTACFSGTGPGGNKQARYDKAVIKAQQRISIIVAKIESFTTAWGNNRCCRHECYKAFGTDEILQLHLAHHYTIKNKTNYHKPWLQSQISNSCTLVSDDITGIKTLSKSSFKISGVDVCPQVFKCIYFVGHDQFNQCRKNCLNGILVVDHTQHNVLSKRNDMHTSKTMILHEFQDRMAACSEVMPNSLTEDNDGVQEIREHTEITDSQMNYNERRVFPCCFTWMSLHTEYVNETSVKYSHLQDEIGTVTYNHFRESFKSRYPNISFLNKDSTAFKCKKCSELRTKLAGATHAGDRLIIESYIKLHTIHFRRARDYYATTIQRCIVDFHVFKELSIVIDGMDQNKCLFPRVTNRFDLAQEDQIKFHLIGSLVHGLGFQGHLLQSRKWTRCASDTNITVLIRTISWVMKITGQIKLPEILHLQLDNCVKENKCNEFFAFLHYLVYIGAFKEIYVNYCVVGHTHIDIDQVFSRLSSRLRRGHLTLTEFMAAMMDSYTYLGRKADIERLEHVAHWGHSMEQNNMMIDKLNGITEPLCYRFRRDLDTADNPVRISYKFHSGKAAWKGSLELLKDTLPTPWATDVCCEPLQVLDVTGIRDGTGDEIMKRFEEKISIHVPHARVGDVRREWQAFADAENAWAHVLCQQCSRLRSLVREVTLVSACLETLSLNCNVYAKLFCEVVPRGT